VGDSERGGVMVDEEKTRSGPVRPQKDWERLGVLYPGWRTYPGDIDIDLVIKQCEWEGKIAAADLADAKEKLAQGERYF
jgi:hypothetical protein